MNKNINEAIEEFGKQAIEAVDPTFAQALEDEETFAKNKEEVMKAKEKEVEELEKENQPFSHVMKKNTQMTKLYLSEGIIVDSDDEDETTQISVFDFEPWEGAVATLDIIKSADKLDNLDMMIEELYPEGIDEQSLNDLLWFERSWVLKMLNIKDEDEEE